MIHKLGSNVLITLKRNEMRHFGLRGDHRLGPKQAELKGMAAAVLENSDEERRESPSANYQPASYLQAFVPLRIQCLVEVGQIEPPMYYYCPNAS